MAAAKTLLETGKPIPFKTSSDAVATSKTLPESMKAMTISNAEQPGSFQEPPDSVQSGIQEVNQEKQATNINELNASKCQTQSESLSHGHTGISSDDTLTTNEQVKTLSISAAKIQPPNLKRVPSGQSEQSIATENQLSNSKAIPEEYRGIFFNPQHSNNSSLTNSAQLSDQTTPRVDPVNKQVECTSSQVW